MSTETQPYARRWQALAVLATSLLVISVGNTILNVALPTIREQRRQLERAAVDRGRLHAGLREPPARRRQPRRSLRAPQGPDPRARDGSALSAIATSATELIAARALTGVGAAGIMPTTLSILTNVFPDHERPKAIAVWAAVVGMGVAIGPIGGGWLIEHFDYRWIFLVNLPAIAACLVGAVILVPESRDPESPRLDRLGLGLSIAGLTAVV